MRFAFPHMLWLLLLLPLVSVGLLWASGVRQKLLNRFSTQKAQQRSFHQISSSIHWSRFSFILVAVVLLIISMARPQWGYHEQRIISRGVDIIVAVDTSSSMLARDFQPNRLTRAKELLRNLIWEAKGSRVGVVAFSGAAVVLCPLTLDYDMAATALKAVDVNTVSTPGTNIGAALRTAASAFEISGANDKILILLTDGEQTELVDQLNATIGEIAKAEIKVFAIGIGGEGGVNIPTLAGPKRDSEGNVVSTALDFDKLEEIADRTGGRAIRADKMGAGEIAEISSELAKFKGTKQDDRTVRIYHDRYPWFIGVAVILLILEALLSSVRGFSGRRGLRSSRNAARKISAVALASCGLLYSNDLSAYPAEDYVKARSAYQEYNGENYDEALRKYEEASSISPESQLLQFNTGATAAHTSDTASAEQRLRAIYDPQNPVLNAKALYGAATLQHRKLRKDIQDGKPGWEAALNQPKEAIDEAKTQLKEKIGSLESVLGDYREALLTYSQDVDFKANYELAQRDRNELQQLLEQLEQQEEQQQQEQPEQQQDNEEKDEEGKEGENDDQSGDKNNPSDQGEKDENEDGKDKPEQPDDKNDQGKTGDQEDGGDKDKPDSPPEGEPGDSGKPNDEPNQQEPQKPQGTPAPTPTPTPAPQPGQNSGDQTPQPGEAPPVPAGQMSPTDVDRLLNTLPSEDQNALQLMFGPQQPNNEMKNDW